jgi:hypothetical protein
LAFHLAAGDTWSGIPAPTARSVLMVENDGPRPQLRAKVQRKLASWKGSPIGERFRIISEPWVIPASMILRYAPRAR